jgi:mannan endo-1,4-beta-mannosidase
LLELFVGGGAGIREVRRGHTIAAARGLRTRAVIRPLHEIDGGWFWWTCKTDPAKTAKLYAILQDRIIKYHQMHNLIWIYNPGVLCDGGSWPSYEASEYPRHKPFYVGDSRCDLVGIDLYDWDWKGKGTYAPDGKDYGKSYRDAWNMMKGITTGKMIALNECQGFPDPAKSITDSTTFAPWLYALPWYSDEANGSKGTDAAGKIVPYPIVQFPSDAGARPGAR